MKEDSFEKVFANVQRVLVIMAHPDDLELICGGIVARLIKTGRRVRAVVMTNGGKGMQDREDILEKEFGQLRISEQKEAGKALGIPDAEIINLNIPDGEIEASVENIKKIVFHIRDFKPDIVISQNPKEVLVKFSDTSRWVNHRDHRNAGLVTWDAVYPYSRDRGFFPEQFTKDHVSPHTVSFLLYSDAYTDPNVKYFDVTDSVTERKNALLQYRSSLSDQEVNDLMEEIRDGDRYFEPLGYTDRLF
jgi:LmbE family N-acetylglucosaminyl deacetylase